MNEHSATNKSNFCAQVKQVLSDIKLKDSYRRREPVDITVGEKNILEGDELKWSNDVLKFSK